MVATEAGRDASPRRPRSGRATSAFTLLEMLVVVAIISVFVGVLGYGFLRGSGSATVGLQAAQTTLAGLVVQAKSQAAISGRTARLYIQYDAVRDPSRFLRFAVVALQTINGAGFEAVTEGVMLPTGCCVVPDPAPSAGLVESPSSWVSLRSSSLDVDATLRSFESSEPQSWLYVEFSPQGKVLGGGNLVVASCRPVEAGGAFPIQIVNPQNVRGIAITRYGQTRLVPNAAGFDAP